MLQTGNAAPVNKVLGNLNKYLNEKAGTKFLLKDTPTYADCQLLPKLQHLRVAAKVSESGGVVSPKTCGFLKYTTSLSSKGYLLGIKGSIMFTCNLFIQLLAS